MAASVAITLDTRPPVLTLGIPAQTVAGLLELAFTVDETAVVDATFYRADGQTFAGLIGGATATFDTEPEPGRIEVEAIDLVGNRTTAEAFIVGRGYLTVTDRPQALAHLAHSPQATATTSHRPAALVVVAHRPQANTTAEDRPNARVEVTDSA